MNHYPCQYFIPTEWGRFAKTNWRTPEILEGRLIKTMELYCNIHCNMLYLNLYERHSCITLATDVRNPEETLTTSVSSCNFKSFDSFDPGSPGEVSPSGSIKGKAKATHVHSFRESLEQDDRPLLYKFGFGSNSNAKDPEPIHSSVGHLAAQSVLALLNITKRDMRSSWLVVRSTSYIEYNQELIYKVLHQLTDNVHANSNFLVSLQCFVGNHIVRLLTDCSPSGEIRQQQREKIRKATKGSVYEMLTCIDVQSTESTLLREIANQNPDDEFLTSLVDCALEKLLAPAAKDNLAGGEATDLAYRSKREAVDCLTGAKEKNCCLPDDTSDDCNWSIIAELPTELGSVNSFSMCEDSDESEDYLAEAEKAMHLLRAKGSSVSKESELTEWNEGCYWYERGEAADRDWFFSN